MKIESNIKNKKLPWEELLFRLVLATILIVSWPTIYRTIVGTCNVLSETIFSVDQMRMLSDTLFTDVEGASEKKGFLKWLPGATKAREMIGFFVSFLCQIAFYVIGYLRYVLLAMSYAVAPVLFGLFMVPIFGASMLVKFFQTVIQVSLWPVFLSLFNVIFITFSNQYQTLFSLEYITLMCLFVIIIVMSPKIIAGYLGGVDFSSISAMTAGLITYSVAKKSAGLGMSGAKATPGGVVSTAKMTPVVAEGAKALVNPQGYMDQFTQNTAQMAGLGVRGWK